MARRSFKRVVESVEIGDMAGEGKCVARIDGQVVFVKDVAPGDVVDIQVYKKKKKFLEAYPTRFITKSKLRQDPFCDHFGMCGGCKWQHIGYETQLHYKRQQVIDNFQRIGGLAFPEVMPIVPASPTQYYRNKLEFTFSDRRWFSKEEIDSKEENLEERGLGFHIPQMFNRIVNIDHCYLQGDPSNAIRDAVRKFAIQEDIPFFNLNTQEGVLRNLIIRTSTLGEVMVILQIKSESESTVRLLNHLKNTFPEITSLLYVVNTKRNETFHDQEIKCFDGKDHIMEQLGEMKFKIGPKSFFQTNSTQAKKLYDVAVEFADLKGDEVVYDLYTGTGTIANYVSQSAKKVVGVEYVPEAIEDAYVNSEINSVKNTDFYAGDMKDVLDEAFIQEHGKPDVIITDPPRAGMHKDVVDMIKRIAAPKVVYVSCNPATQARDLELMADLYEIKKVQPVDMFPYTHHVESVVLLELK